MANPIGGLGRALFGNVIDFSTSGAEVTRQKFIDKVRGVLEDMPYTMNLPYEIGKKLNSEGKLPLPLGTKLMPIGGQVARRKGYPHEVHKVIGYKGDIHNPDLYGYEIQAPNGKVFFQAISNPVTGLSEQRADKVGSFTAALGPDGLEQMPFVAPSRTARRATEKPQRSESEQKIIDQEYDDLFGGGD